MLLSVDVFVGCYKYWSDFMTKKMMLKYFFDWYYVMKYSFSLEHITASEARYMEILAHKQEADLLNNSEDCVLVLCCCLLVGAYPYAGGKFLEEF
jgi:hypothetical protein